MPDEASTSAQPTSAPQAAAPARAAPDPIPPGRPAIAAPPKVRRPPRHQVRARGAFLHDHPVAAPRLRGHAKPAEGE